MRRIPQEQTADNEIEPEQLQLAQFKLLNRSDSDSMPPDDCHYCINGECEVNFFMAEDAEA